MNLPETAKLLTAAAAFDQRTIGKADVAAWQQALKDVRYADAELALFEHYRGTRDRVMPFDILDGVKTIRSNRVREHVRRFGGYVPSPGLDPLEELEERRQWHERIADGLSDTPAIEGPR